MTMRINSISGHYLVLVNYNNPAPDWKKQPSNTLATIYNLPKVPSHLQLHHFSTGKHQSHVLLRTELIDWWNIFWFCMVSSHISLNKSYGAPRDLLALENNLLTLL